MAATPSKPQAFVTTNLVLATTLSMEGYEYQMLVLDREGAAQDHPQGAWQFESNPDLVDYVDDFKDGDSRVEPEAFQKQLNNVRRELFDFLGVK